MSFTKKYDLVVKTGSYTNKTGETKNRYQQVGSLMENEDNKKFLLIDPTFNFAGVKLDDGKDRVLVSLFEPKVKETSGYLTETPKITDPADINWQE